MKKLLIVFALCFIAIGFAACGPREKFEIAMITDVGDIDDESFNQGTWEGIVEYAEANDISYKYYRPTEVSDAAYLDAINLAVEGGAEIIVTPGFLFETAIYQAQDLHPDVMFVLIDGEPHDGDWAGGPDFNIGDNTVSVIFAEHESGFLAGYAAVKDGYENLGFIGGMAVPAVVLFGIGYVAGAYYAAIEDDIVIAFPDNRYHYLGNFEESEDNKNVALAWYTTGTEIIFAAAGGAGGSVMAAATDEAAMMIGVDIDQGHLSDTVLTSAMKELGNAVQQILEMYYDDEFPGGEQLLFDATNDGIGLPTAAASWRFDTFDSVMYEAILADIANGTIVVPRTYDELMDLFLDLFDEEPANLQTILDGLDFVIEEETIHPPPSE